MALSPTDVHAQWVPPPGQGSLSLGYQYTRIYDHLFSVDVDGVVDPVSGYVGGPDNHFYYGDIFGQTVTLSGAYGVWHGLALNGGVAYVTSKYTGKFPEGLQDDGSYHGSIQDATLTAQYMIPWQQFAITPFIGAELPLRNYETLGHVSVGKHLKEMPVGIAIGRSLSPLLPRAYLGGSFAYAFVEDDHMYDLDQRRWDGSVGYAITNAFSVGGVYEHVETIDGVDWWYSEFTEDMWEGHDAAAKAKYTRVGGYVGFSMMRGLSTTVSFMDTVDGENTHSSQSITVTPTWTFGGPKAR